MKVFQTIKECFTSTYNPTTGKIVGCEQGSLMYRHEEQHLKDYQTGKITLYSSIIGALVLTTLVLLAFNISVLIAKITALLAVFLVLKLEVRAWWYAIFSYKKSEKEVISNGNN